MTPVIPFSFDPSAAEYEEAHLIYKKTASGEVVSWPIAGVSFFVPTYEYYPTPSDIQNTNSGLFTMHDSCGYSIGTYHEFLIGELPTPMAFKMGSIEVSFGQATPIAAYLFDYVYREKYFGEWPLITSARIIGAKADDAELVFINASLEYLDLVGSLPTIVSMDLDFLIGEPEDVPDADVKIAPPAINDLEPLRFYYHGLSETDGASACIYFFRVLEFYSFLSNQAALTELRHNKTVGEFEFAKKTLEIITKDEKGPLLKLIKQLSDNSVLDKALEGGLVEQKSAALLAESLYAFRNSIVHGKFSYGYELLSSSVVSRDVGTTLRRDILKQLARRAMRNFGSKLL